MLFLEKESTVQIFPEKEATVVTDILMLFPEKEATVHIF